MPRGSSSIIAQSFKTLQQNGHKLVYTQKNPNNNECMFIIDILSLCEKKKRQKKPTVTKTTPLLEDNYFY